MININNTNELFIVIDGLPDWDAMDAIYAQKRRAALVQAGHDALSGTIAQSIEIGRRAGELALNVLDELIQSAR